MESSYKNAPDSPSRQLLWELSRLSVSEQEQLYERLDHDAEDKASLHRHALAQAAAEHARIRQEAELEKQKLEAQQELEREIKVQNDLREIERVRQEKAKREATIRRETEEAQASARRAEAQRKAEEAAAATRAREETERAAAAEAQRRADEEQRKRNAADVEAKAKAAAIAAQKKRAEAEQQKRSTTLPSKPPTPAKSAFNGPTGTTVGRDNEAPEQEHQRYLAIWRKLKELRSFVKDTAKSNPDFKKAMGDGRRVIRKCVGQLVTDAKNPRANAQPNMEIRNVIRDSHRFTEPTVPVIEFLFRPSPELNSSQIPALFLYLMHIFAKCLVSQFLGEVAIAPNTATTIGITGATIFAQDDCRWQGESLIDVFIAKYHRVCPVLFGITGDDTTSKGKQRLGWWYTDDAKTAFCTEQRHYERMTGLGAGFAAMTLRAYKNRTSPYPAWHFWHAAARILNTPRAAVTDTHLVVLKSMIEGNEGRVLDFFGRAGRALLHFALVEFPTQVPTRDGVAAKALLLIPEVLKSEKRLFL